MLCLVKGFAFGLDLCCQFDVDLPPLEALRETGNDLRGRET